MWEYVCLENLRFTCFKEKTARRKVVIKKGFKTSTIVVSLIAVLRNILTSQFISKNNEAGVVDTYKLMPDDRALMQ